jgi:CubicO group peptidase (beta-lactamase class C family)
VLDSKGTRLLGHTGSQAGFRSFFYFNPANGAAVVAAFNTTNSSTPARMAQGRMNAAALDLLR